MTDIIIAAVIIIIIGLAAWYVIKAKRNGEKCIGCPHSKACRSAKDGSCSCCSSNESSKAE